MYTVAYIFCLDSLALFMGGLRITVTTTTPQHVGLHIQKTIDHQSTCARQWRHDTTASQFRNLPFVTACLSVDALHAIALPPSVSELWRFENKNELPCVT